MELTKVLEVYDPNRPCPECGGKVENKFNRKYKKYCSNKCENKVNCKKKRKRMKKKDRREYHRKIRQKYVKEKRCMRCGKDNSANFDNTGYKICDECKIKIGKIVF